MKARAAALCLAWLFALMALSGVARASKPEVTAQLDTDVVGEGDEVRLTLQAFSDEGPPQNPSPGSTSGFTVVGSSSGPSQSVMIQNGRISRKQGLNTTWTLRATRQGTFTLGPCTVTIAGTRYSTQTLRVNVVAPGQAPQRVDPFDPFGMGSPLDPFRRLLDNFPQAVQPQQPSTDPRLALDAPRGKFAFLHSSVDKISAVVGEQVTLAVYLYVEAAEREAELNDVHEASADDFVKRSLVEDDAGDKNLQTALVGGAVYHVKLLRKWALFPLKTGDLEIGPMSLTLSRRRGGGRGAPNVDQLRQSETLSVHVTEPPLAGRPPGYVVGDTGHFALSAETSPRDIEQDGAVGVTLDLSGTGNLPSSITPPARAGIEWLAPEMHEKMSPVSGDRYGGKRTFAFVVRLHKSGLVDMGEITLPYYNPETRAYGVARATLGVVNVRPGTAAAPSAEPAFDPFAGLPPAREKLAPPRAGPTHLADTPLFWLGLAATPLAYAFLATGQALVRRVRDARAAKAASPETDLKARMAAAAQACRGTDSRAADAAVARALHAATIAKVGINVRDAEGPEVSRRLAGAGVDGELARRVEELIRDCEAARFSPEAAEMGAVRERWQTAQGVVGALKKTAVAVLAFVMVFASASATRAAEDTDGLFASGAAALAEGRPGDAIADLEALADRGVVDPAASFDRGLAYAGRIRASAEQPGDLGRAAHGFAEAHDLASDPVLVKDATSALTLVRTEVARRRARAGDPIELDQGVSLGRAIVELLPENAWAILAASMSLLLGVGLFVRGAVSARRQRIGATLVCSVSAPLLLACALLTLGARSERLHLVEGIVVAPSARPADDKGLALPGATPMPEAARVQIVGERPGWVRVERGSLVAWLPSQTVRPLSRRD